MKVFLVLLSMFGLLLQQTSWAGERGIAWVAVKGKLQIVGESYYPDKQVYTAFKIITENKQVYFADEVSYVFLNAGKTCKVKIDDGPKQAFLRTHHSLVMFMLAKTPANT
jgi:hypothetical protein